MGLARFARQAGSLRSRFRQSALGSQRVQLRAQVPKAESRQRRDRTRRRM